MRAYGEFADLYDLFMEDIPYASWKDFICGYLAKQGIRDGILLDLGCGTGQMTRLLRDAGYDMIGVDASAEMLARAAQTDAEGILYLCQDMTSFELYGTVRAVVSVCDCMNYLLTKKELLACFKLVHNYLDPGGIFLFDMNSIFKYEQMGEGSFCENRPEASFIWDNYYDPDTRENEYDLTFFVQEEGDLYRKFEECHVQKGYTIEEIRELLEEAGFVWMGVYDGYSERPGDENAERLLFAAREQGKETTLHAGNEGK